MGVDPQYGDVFARAQEDLAGAQRNYDSGAYEQSIALSQKVVSDLEGLSAAARN